MDDWVSSLCDVATAIEAQTLYFAHQLDDEAIKRLESLADRFASLLRSGPER